MINIHDNNGGVMQCQPESHANGEVALDLFYKGIGDEGAKDLAKVLMRPDCKITYLNLSCNDIGSDGARVLQEALEVNKSVTKLSVRSNIGSGLANGILKALKCNTMITKLDLGGGGDLGTEEMQTLKDVLQSNGTLAKLKLDGCRICKNGGVAIGEALKVNKALREIDLRLSGIDDNGAEAIAAALPKNCTLDKLYLDYRGMSTKGTSLLLSALPQNHSITEMTVFSKAEFDGYESKTLSPFLERNKKKKEEMSKQHKRVTVLIQALRATRTHDLRNSILDLIKNDIAYFAGWRPAPASMQADQQPASDKAAE